MNSRDSLAQTSEKSPEKLQCSATNRNGERCSMTAVEGATRCHNHNGAAELAARRRQALVSPDRYSELLKGEFREAYLKYLDDPERLDLGAELSTQRVLLSGFLKQVGEVPLEKMPAEALGALEGAISGIRETVKVIGQLEGKLTTHLSITDVHFVNVQIVEAVNVVLGRYITDPAKLDEVMKAISDELGRCQLPAPAGAG